MLLLIVAFSHFDASHQLALASGCNLRASTRRKLGPGVPIMNSSLTRFKRSKIQKRSPRTASSCSSEAARLFRSCMALLRTGCDCEHPVVIQHCPSGVRRRIDAVGAQPIAGFPWPIHVILGAAGVRVDNMHPWSCTYWSRSGFAPSCRQKTCPEPQCKACLTAR